VCRRFDFPPRSRRKQGSLIDDVIPHVASASGTEGNLVTQTLTFFQLAGFSGPSICAMSDKDSRLRFLPGERFRGVFKMDFPAIFRLPFSLVFVVELEERRERALSPRPSDIDVLVDGPSPAVSSRSQPPPPPCRIPPLGPRLTSPRSVSPPCSKSLKSPGPPAGPEAGLF